MAIFETNPAKKLKKIRKQIAKVMGQMKDMEKDSAKGISSHKIFRKKQNQMKRFSEKLLKLENKRKRLEMQRKRKLE